MRRKASLLEAFIFTTALRLFGTSRAGFNDRNNQPYSGKTDKCVDNLCRHGHIAEDFRDEVDIQKGNQSPVQRSDSCEECRNLTNAAFFHIEPPWFMGFSPMSNYRHGSELAGCRPREGGGLIKLDSRFRGNDKIKFEMRHNLR